jgi:hypothetical protein
MNTDDEDLQHTVAPSLNDHLTIAGLLGDELTAAPPGDSPMISGNVTSTLTHADIYDSSSLVPHSQQQDLHTPPYVVSETETHAFIIPPANVQPTSTSGLLVKIN